MNVLNLAAQLAKAGSMHGNTISKYPRIDAAKLRAFVAAPRPEFGKVSWALPESYADWLTQAGRFDLEWFSPSCEMSVSLSLLTAEGIREAGEFVYLPEGVVRGADGPALSTNHLVPFCSAGDATFCFDVTQGDDYPIYYNHEDEARARLLSNGEWEDGVDAEPDFENFTAWMHWLVDALTRAADPEGVGHPRGKLPALSFDGCGDDDCDCEYKAPG